MMDNGIGKQRHMRGDKKSVLRLQQCLIRLEQGRYGILDDDRFVTELVKYLFDLYRFRYFGFAHGVLNILGNCSVCSTPRYREKSLFVLSLFAESVVKEDNDQAIQALSWIFSKWLRMEQEYLSCFEHVCRQIQSLLKSMLQRGMYCQLSPWLQLFESLSRREFRRSGAIQAVVGRMHSSLKHMLMYHNPGMNGVSVIAHEDSACLLGYLSENGAAGLVHELYGSTDKEQRLALIAILSRQDDEVAYLLIENLAENSSWYTIRNAVHIISHLGSTQYFDLVQPFMGYPDVRVQQEVIAFIARLDAERAIEELLLALEVCDDSLKFQAIHNLAALGSKAAEMSLLHLLDNSADFEPAIRDDLVLQLCTELSHFPTVRVVQYLRALIAERELAEIPCDPIILRAEETIDILSSGGP